MQAKKIAILGTRGIPAGHGGFETFVESLAPYLASAGHSVSVYCQVSELNQPRVSTWRGVELVSIQPSFSGALATFDFDLKSIRDVCNRRPDFVFVFGYNTAILCLLLKIKKIPFAINMDGLEWKRKKWNFIFKIWFWLNEKIGAWIANGLIADHIEIKKHLACFVNAAKITYIPYGAERIESADKKQLTQFKDVQPYQYAIFIGRPEPENHVLEIVRAFSAKPRNFKLVVLGDYASSIGSYQKAVIHGASADVLFPGAVYDPKAVEALLFFSRIYCHGHSVGGTNPSLVQAMSAGCRIIAHDNLFNRGVLSDQAAFFKGEQDLKSFFDLFVGSENRIFYSQLMSSAAINKQYEDLIFSLLSSGVR